MGKLGYRIAIGGGSLHNERGDAVLKDDVKNYRQAWMDAGHPGVPSVAIRMNTRVAATQREADQMAQQRPTAKHEGSADDPRRSSDLYGTPGTDRGPNSPAARGLRRRRDHLHHAGRVRLSRGHNEKHTTGFGKGNP